MPAVGGCSRFIENYWVRTGHGIEFRLSRIPGRARLPIADRLMLAILRRDAQQAQDILTNAPQAQWLDQLADFFGSEQLVALIYSRIHELGLANSLEPLKISNGAPLLSHMRQAAANAAQSYEQRNTLFVELLKLFQTIDPPVVFLKGTVLARVLYEQPQFRLSTDFDILVHEDAAPKVIELLERRDFNAVWNHPGHCPQFGIGPVGTLAAVAIRPSPDLEPFHNITFEKNSWPFIELKSTILESGLAMVETDRFWHDCLHLDWQGQSYGAPSVIDHLMLELVHFRKHLFIGWPWLYDVHLLIEQVDKMPGAWDEFTRRCRIEGITYGAWAALEVVRDRLDSPVPDRVLEALRPSGSLAAKWLAYVVEPAFVWNLVGLPALWLNALFAGDTRRKLKILHDCLLPTQTFLQDYYANRRTIKPWQFPLLLFLHWLVLLLPGSITRRTFGRLLWNGVQAL